MYTLLKNRINISEDVQWNDKPQNSIHNNNLPTHSVKKKKTKHRVGQGPNITPKKSLIRKQK